MSPRETEKYTSISLSSLRGMANKKGLKQFKRLKTSWMSENMKKKTSTERAGALAERFGKNFRALYLAGWKRVYSWSPSQFTKQSCLCKWQQECCTW